LASYAAQTRNDAVTLSNRKNRVNIVSLPGIVERISGILSWKWDSRFETVLAEFGVDVNDSVRAALQRHLSMLWDSASIATASP
jgi:hypothetical protein